MLPRARARARRDRDAAGEQVRRSRLFGLAATSGMEAPAGPTRDEPSATTAAAPPPPRRPRRQAPARLRGAADGWVDRRAGGRGIRRGHRRLGAVDHLAEAHQPGLLLPDLRRQRPPPRVHPVGRAAQPGPRQPDPRACSSGPRWPSRTSASTSTTASTRGRSSAPPCKNLESGKSHPGRLDDHDAARPQPLHRTPKRTFKRKIREAKLAQQLEKRHDKTLDPRQVPEHGPLRDGRRADRGGRPGGGADLLRQARLRARPPRRRPCSPACPRRPPSTTRSATVARPAPAATTCSAR